MFAKHGFQDLAEKARLGRFLIEKFSSGELEGYSAPERMRMAFEKLGPTFIKFGQLLATRPDLIPKDFVDEFKKLHDQAPTIPIEHVRRVLDSHFGTELGDIFSDFDEKPLAAASVAQVHKATLITGEPVVVKVQRPGIDTVIEEDLNVLYTLAELIGRYVPEAELYNPTGVVDEFFRSLELETNFIVEANNIRRFQNNFEDDEDVIIPEVYTELTGRRVLVMERLEGIPLSHKNALDQEGINSEEILRKGLKTYLRMVFVHGLFHGDLHAGNLFVMPGNRIGLIDFGVVGRLNRKTQGAIANMMLALSDEDYDRLAYLYADMAPYTDSADVDRFARELRDLIAPYFGLSLKHVNVGRLLMDSTGIAASHRMKLPSELVMFFKSMVTIEGMGRLINRDFDFLAYALEFADELVKARYEPKRIAKDVGNVVRDVNALVQFLPRQMKQFARKVNSPEYSLKMSIRELDNHRRSIEKASDLVFLAVVIGSLLMSSSIVILAKPEMATIAGLPILSTLGFGAALFLGLLAFYNYIRR